MINYEPKVIQVAQRSKGRRNRSFDSAQRKVTIQHNHTISIPFQHQKESIRLRERERERERERDIHGLQPWEHTAD